MMIKRALAGISEPNCGLPHPIHLHCNSLGVPGNFATTLETMKVLEGRRAHFAHLQFHAYGGDDWPTMRSEAATLAEYRPTMAGQLIELVLPRTVSGNRHGISEQDRSGIGRKVLVRVEILGQGGRLRAHRRPVVSAGRVKLQMGEMRTPSFENLHRLQRGREIARHTQTIAVDVEWMRQPQFVDDAGKARDNHRRRDAAVTFNRLVELVWRSSPISRPPHRRG